MLWCLGVEGRRYAGRRAADSLAVPLLTKTQAGTRFFWRKGLLALYFQRVIVRTHKEPLDRLFLAASDTVCLLHGCKVVAGVCRTKDTTEAHSSSPCPLFASFRLA